MNRLRPLALGVALACAGSVSAADPSASQALPLARSTLKSQAKLDPARISAPPTSHHEMRATVMADGSVRIDCVQVAGGIEKRHEHHDHVPTEAK